MKDLKKRRKKIIGKSCCCKCFLLIQCQGEKWKRILHNGQKTAVSQTDFAVDTEIIAVVGKWKYFTDYSLFSDAKYGVTGFRFGGGRRQ